MTIHRNIVLAISLSLGVSSAPRLIASGQAPVAPSAEISALVARLKDASAEARARAAIALGERGKGAMGASAQLAEVIESDTDSEVRIVAATALGQIFQAQSLRNPSPINSRVNSALLRGLKQDPIPRVRMVCALALGLIGWRETEGALVDAMKDSDVEVRAYTAAALGVHHYEGEGTLRALMAALNDPQSVVWGYAANSIGHYGQAASGTIPRLLQIGRDAGVAHQVRGAAIQAIELIGQPASRAALSALIEMLPDTEGEVRDATVSLLYDLRDVAIPMLQRQAKDSSPRVRTAAADALTALDKMHVDIDQQVDALLKGKK